MSLSATHGKLCTDNVRVHVYDYNYEHPSGYIREPDHDLLALFAVPPRDATGVYRSPIVTTPRLSLGGMMIIPANTVIEAIGGLGEQRLATCTMSPGLLPHDFEVGDTAQLSMCSNIQDRNIRLEMQRLANEALSPGFASDLLVDGLTRALRADLARYFGEYLTSTGKIGVLAPWQLRKIESFASETQGSPVRVAALAAEVGISPGHLMRAFRQSTGQTVHEFVEQVRVARARALLLDSQKPIKQIAALLGFATPSSFILAFRRATGQSPAQFRREKQNLH